MSAKMGRPKTENPMSISLNTRIDARLYARLQAYCQRTGATKGEVIRKGIALVLADEKK